VTQERGWYALLQDANLTEAEFARWQRLQDDGLSATTALAVVLQGRRFDSKGSETSG
jgi:hypothetical protein